MKKLDSCLANRVRITLESGAQPAEFWASVQHGAELAGAAWLATAARDHLDSCDPSEFAELNAGSLDTADTAELSEEERAELRAALHGSELDAVL